MTDISKINGIETGSMSKVNTFDVPAGGAAAGDRGIALGGKNSGGTSINNIEYITISTPSNSTDFGDLSGTRSQIGAISNSSGDRGLAGNGYIATQTNIIEYITISTPGDATDFGDSTAGRSGPAGSLSNGANSVGVWGGGQTSGAARVNIIDYVNISTTGNARDFGDLLSTNRELTGTSNYTYERGIFAGGNPGTQTNVIQYITVSITSNAIDFGDLTLARNDLNALSNGTNDRGVMAGGYTGAAVTNVMDYVTISSLGNAIDFSDLSVARYYTAAMSNVLNERGCWGGGNTGSRVNVIDYFTINSPGSSSDFGDLLVITDQSNGTSNA